VQLHQKEDPALVRNVGVYVREGLRRGEGVLLIATPEQWERFRERVNRSGVDVKAAESSGQLVYSDANETLARFMRHGQPDWHRFERTIRAMTADVSAEKRTGLRAYGEMVGVLWEDRQFSAAVRLEQYWNRLMAQSSFSLYCAYAIDILGPNFRAETVECLLCEHTHLIPAETGGRFEASLMGAVEDVLGSDAKEATMRLRQDRHPSRSVLPNAEAALLWLRKNFPDSADEIAEQSRVRYLHSRRQA
jgi:hypothetical protein